MPNNPRASGISRRIEGEERDQLREALNDVAIPEGMGVIIRTAGIGRSAEEVQWDLDYLSELWKAIKQATDERPAPFLVYQEGNVIMRALRDYLGEDTGEVLIDAEHVYNDVQSFVQSVMPRWTNRIKLYRDDTPLFSRYQIESQIESAFQREVHLPSGGAIVIDQTEALVSIDINSARATKGGDIEETALNTNLEAADEIARQLKLRDVGGLIVIDFIDMMPARNQREVENRMRDALRSDRARVQFGRLSRFGLMEMSRQRLRPSLGETAAQPCPRCSGQGHIRDVSSLALAILRLIEEEALKDRTAEIRAIVPVAVAAFLMNEKRALIAELEELRKVRVRVIPNPHMETPHYLVERLRDDHEAVLADVQEASHELIPQGTIPREASESPAAAVRPQTAAVSSVTINRPPPVHVEEEPAASEETSGAEESGWWQRSVSMFSRMFGAGEEKAPAADTAPEQPSRKAAGGEPSRSRSPSGTSGEGRRTTQRSSSGNRNQRDRGRTGSGGQSRGGNRRGGARGRDDSLIEAGGNFQADSQDRKEQPRRNRPKAEESDKAEEKTGNVRAAQTETDTSRDNADSESGQQTRRRRRRGGRGRRGGVNRSGGEGSTGENTNMPDAAQAGETTGGTEPGAAKPPRSDDDAVQEKPRTQDRPKPAGDAAATADASRSAPPEAVKPVAPPQPAPAGTEAASRPAEAPAAASAPAQSAPKNVPAGTSPAENRQDAPAQKPAAPQVAPQAATAPTGDSGATKPESVSKAVVQPSDRPAPVTPAAPTVKPAAEAPPVAPPRPQPAGDADGQPGRASNDPRQRRQADSAGAPERPAPVDAANGDR